MAFVTGGSIFNNFPIAKLLVLVFLVTRWILLKATQCPCLFGVETWFWVVGTDCSSLVTFLQLKQTQDFAATGCTNTWFNMLNFEIMYY